MGIFDRFKKQKGSSPEEGGKVLSTENKVAELTNLYREYISIFIQFLSQGNYAPISAYQKKDGEIVGLLIMREENGAYEIQAGGAVVQLTERLEGMLQCGEITSFVVLYHTDTLDLAGPFTVADDDQLMKAIAIAYHHASLGSGTILLPWEVADGYLNFRRIDGLDDGAFNALLETELVSGKDYFADRITSTAPSEVNAYGIKVVRHNTLTVANMWGGLLGFHRTKGDYWEKEYEGWESEMGSFPVIGGSDPVKVRERAMGDCRMRGWTYRSGCLALAPVVPSATVLDAVPREICVWDNYSGELAIVGAKAKDTFGLWFFALDYCQKKAQYARPDACTIRLGGLVYVLNIHENKRVEGEPGFADNFAGYFPSSHLPHYACFDFIGGVLAVTPVNLDAFGVEGFYLTVRMINHEEDADFFNLDMFVAKENMRFEGIQVGMQVTGMVQLIGERVE